MQKLIPFLLLLLPIGTAYYFPSYTIKSHPFSTDSQFASLPKNPVIMSTYTLHTDRRNLKNLRFVKDAGSYKLSHSNTPFATKLDLLYTQQENQIEGINNADYLSVTLNGPARVILLLSSEVIRREGIPNKPMSISGLPSRWNTPRVLSVVESEAWLQTPRMSEQIRLPTHAASLETTLANGETLNLPHPHKVDVNGNQIRQYILLFAKPSSSNSIPKPFPYQTTPSTFRNRQNGAVTKPETVKPNEACPAWVHDMYMAASRDDQMAEKNGEPRFWRTWHPPIDQYYWCYLNHEHGSFPGYYEPTFGYTAYKTQDTSTADDREKESHEGFKVFSSTLREQERFLIFVVHMHLSDARRFTQRRHTIVVAVLDKNWKLELEFHMKGDFGFAHATGSKQAPSSTLPFTEEDRRIMDELDKKDIRASRRFNVLLIDKDYPRSVDPRIELRGRQPASKSNLDLIRVGLYESWIAPINTCTTSSNNRQTPSINFDCRNPATAKRTLNGKNGLMTELAGTSVDRFFASPKSIKIDPQYCSFFNSEQLAIWKKSNGVFFTDPYFSKVEPTSGKFVVRQYMKPGLKEVFIPEGRRVATGAWYSHFEEEKYQRGSSNGIFKYGNPEGAVLRNEN